MLLVIISEFVYVQLSKSPNLLVLGVKLETKTLSIKPSPDKIQKINKYLSARNLKQPSKASEIQAVRRTTNRAPFLSLSALRPYFGRQCISRRLWWTASSRTLTGRWSLGKWSPVLDIDGRVVAGYFLWSGPSSKEVCVEGELCLQ